MNIDKTKWSGHALLGRIAYEGLHQWEKDIIRPDLSLEGLNRPYIPEWVKNAGDKMGWLCSINDFVYYGDCRPYATLPDGRWIPHCPPDEHLQASTGSGLPVSPLAYVDLIELLLIRTVNAVRSGEWEEFVRHGGALAHFIQEPFTPGHAVPNEIFHEIFPDPDAGRHMRLHHAFDCASGDCPPPKAGLMGTDVKEAAFRIYNRINLGIREGKKLIGPVIRSFFEGQPDSVRSAMLSGQSAAAAGLTCSVWHTAICIGLNRFDNQDIAAVSNLELTDLVPFFWHACQYVEPLPCCLVKDGRKIPIHIWSINGAGGKIEELVTHGFGMGGYMGAKYFVNGDIYTRFRCRVGLPSRHTEGQNEHTCTRFSIQVDEGENRTYSEEMSYGAKEVYACDLLPGEPVREIDVDISGARTLILSAISRLYRDQETGNVDHVTIPHVAVCEPRLIRTI